MSGCPARTVRKRGFATSVKHHTASLGKCGVWAVVAALLIMPQAWAQETMVGQTPPEAPGTVKLLSPIWSFGDLPTALSTLSVQVPEGGFVAPASSTSSFTIKFTANLGNVRGTQNILLEIADVLRVQLRQHDPQDRNRQNYPSFKMPDGSVPVLEATLVLHSVEHPDWTNMTIGVPLAMLQSPGGEHEVVLNFTGPDWQMYVDGEMLDNDFPFGYPRWAATNMWKLNPARVKGAALHLPGLKPTIARAVKPHTAPGIQYWTPRGHNNWVGDVETCFFKGRYHIFYLYDRRHHASKFGCGAHYFEHLSTSDFKTWTEHEAATPLQEQWECIGTGVPFALSNRLYLSYGLHTTRVYPAEKTTLPAQWDYLKKHGHTGSFPRATTPGFPAGSTYSVCTDDLAAFQKSGIMFHPCENPSVYTEPGGKLRLLANYRSKGTWESASLDQGWQPIDPEFPPGGDCTIYFRWGEYDYVIGGFTGLWSKRSDAPETAYEDVVRKGLDFYDGSSVPAITEIPGGRFLMAAWVPIRGWGGPLIIRELVQFPDGRVGSKWMSEVTPATGKSRLVAERLSETSAFPVKGESFLLTFNVRPTEAKRGRMAVSLLPADGEKNACELQIDLAARRAQFGPGSQAGFAERQKSLREGGAPHQVGNYAIENLTGVEQGFPVRVIVHSNAKLGGSLIDVEIAGQRTMISFREDLTVGRIHCRSDQVAIENLTIGPAFAKTEL